MKFIGSHVVTINHDQFAPAVHEFGCKAEGLVEVRPCSSEIVPDRQEGSIDTFECRKVYTKRRIIIEVAKIGCKDRITRHGSVKSRGNDMGGSGGFNGGPVGRTCDVCGRQVMGDRSRDIASGSKPRVG